MPGSTGGIGGPSPVPEPKNQPSESRPKKGIKEKLVKLSGGIFMKRDAEKTPVQGSKFTPSKETKSKQKGFENVAKLGKESATEPKTWKEVKAHPAFGEPVGMKSTENENFRYSTKGKFKIQESPTTPGQFRLSVVKNSRQGSVETFFFKADETNFILLNDDLQPQKTYNDLSSFLDDIALKTGEKLSPYKQKQNEIDRYTDSVENSPAFNKELRVSNHPWELLTGLAADRYIITPDPVRGETFSIWIGNTEESMNFKATTSGFVRLDSKNNPQGKNFPTLASFLDSVARGRGSKKLEPYDEQSLIKENEETFTGDTDIYSGSMNDGAATQRLQNLSPGAYMLRKSKTAGLFSFSTVDVTGKVHHINFMVTPQGFVRVPANSKDSPKNDIKSLLNKIISDEGLSFPIPHTKAYKKPPETEDAQLKMPEPPESRLDQYKGERTTELGSIVTQVLFLLDLKETNPYQILGVNDSTNKATLNKKWKEMTSITHPDKLQGGNNNPDYKLIEEANKTINGAWTQIKKERNWG